jgi:RNA polymerase sigma-70 factor (ECF subfamily)
MPSDSGGTHPPTSLVTSPGDKIGGAAPGEHGPAGGASRPVLTREQLEAVRRREPEALSAFFERYFDQVFGLIYRLLGERAAAEDVTQDVFLKVHRAADRLDASRDPAPWLTTIAYNACRDLWRSGAHRMARRSDPVDDDPELGVRLTRGTNDPEDDALRVEREHLVQGAIGRLPEMLRVPVVLHDYQGLSHQEIAAVLGIHHAAARKRYSRALTALGALLRDTLGRSD